ncbi:MAG: NUDIX domain-containing protein [archaeon]
MNKELKIKEKILKELIHNPKSSFSDLFDHSISSNKFTYYLNLLIKEGLIEKDKSQKYCLTTKGRNLEASLDGSTGETRKRPFVAMLLVAKRGSKYLLYHRLKEPYYGYYGFIGAKLDFEEEILDGAKRELFEECGLVGDGEIIIINNTKTTEQNKELAHFLQFVILFQDPTGDLIEKGREGEYKFVNKKEFIRLDKEKKLFPDNLTFIRLLEKFNGTVHFNEIIMNFSSKEYNNVKIKKIF